MTNPWDAPGMAAQINNYWETSKLEAEWYSKLDTYLKEVILPGTVLEVGCGSGKVHVLLGNRPYIGVDISESMLELHRKAFPDSQLHKVEPYILPFDDNSQDVVLCISVLQHIDCAEIGKLLAELCRVARKKLIISTWAGMGEPIVAKDADGFWQNTYNVREIVKQIHSYRTSVYNSVDNLFMKNYVFCFEYEVRDAQGSRAYTGK